MEFPKKFPTALGILLLILVVGGGIVIFESITRLPSKASSSEKPLNVQFSNISDSTFTVTWTTDEQTSGAIILNSSGQRAMTINDERDGSGKLGLYTTHSVIFRQAAPDSIYDISLLSNGRTYNENDDKPYTVQTGSTLPPNTNSLEPAYGKVVTQEGQPADGALVFFILEGGQALSTLTKSSGSWLMPLNLARTSSLDKYLVPSDRHTIHIQVLHDIERATAITDTYNDSPVPDMILGKQYDFRKQQAKVETKQSHDVAGATQEQSQINETPMTTPSPITTNQQLPEQNIGGLNTDIQLVAPKEGASLTSTLPLFQGTGIPQKHVTLTVGIQNPTTTATQIGDDGVWRYTPEKPLAPGKQSVTATTVDETNKPIAMTHTFTILKSGTQVLGDATPSATLTPTPTNVASPTATLTTTPTPTATLAGQQVPTSGTFLPTIMLLLLSITMIISGFVVLL
ncbi:Ig-like domain-containing protein [Patescibacteria group bacterium]